MNLITDYQVDSLGRPTQELGPLHTISLNGAATVVRTATWTIYQDSTDSGAASEVWVGQGYATGNPPLPPGEGRGEGGLNQSNYTFTLLNPVAITRYNDDGQMTDQIVAIRGYTAGPLLPTDSFPQSTYYRWTNNQYDETSGQLAATRVYFAIPASGGGVEGVNYNETDVAYDGLGRQNRVVNGGKTITRTVFDPRDFALSAWAGTNDTGATDNDPTGGGAFLPLPPGEGRGEGASPRNSGNNMAAIQINQYDGNASGGDGNLTLQTLPVDGDTANDRVTALQYDWRNRQVRITAPQDWYQANTFDTMNRVTQVDRHAQATNNLIARQQTLFDDRGQVYQTIVFGVDPSTGTVGNSLTSNRWFDPSGNVIMSLPAGSSAFTKAVYDGAGRQTVQYVGFYLPLPPGEGRGEGGLLSPEDGPPGPSSQKRDGLGRPSSLSAAGVPTYAQAVDISGATIMEQLETLYDDASNVIQTTTRQRFHNATGLGPLTQPGGAQPQARVSYVAAYPDGIGRAIATADYGTNGDATLTRPDVMPTSSATVLLALTVFNSRGEPYQAIDPAGRVDQATLDDAGRRLQLIENLQASSSSSSSSSSSYSSSSTPTSDDKNRTTNWTWNADDNIATVTAVNAETGNQTTAYGYGTTLATSDVARNDVLSSVTYADGGVVSYLVNAQSQVKQLTDQNGTVQQYSIPGRLRCDAQLFCILVRGC